MKEITKQDKILMNCAKYGSHAAADPIRYQVDPVVQAAESYLNAMAVYHKALSWHSPDTDEHGKYAISIYFRLAAICETVVADDESVIAAVKSIARHNRKAYGVPFAYIRHKYQDGFRRAVQA